MVLISIDPPARVLLARRLMRSAFDAIDSGLMLSSDPSNVTDRGAHDGDQRPSSKGCC